MGIEPMWWSSSLKPLSSLVHTTTRKAIESVVTTSIDSSLAEISFLLYMSFLESDLKIIVRDRYLVSQLTKLIKHAIS